MKKLFLLVLFLNLISLTWASDPELKNVMRLSQPFDRGSSFAASVDAIITSKRGKETLMQYKMYTSRNNGKINVMIDFFAPKSFNGTRILSSVSEEGENPNVSVKFKSFFTPFNISSVKPDMSFFGMDFTSGDMNPRNSDYDVYTLLQTSILEDGSPCYIVEAIPIENKQYHRVVHYVDMSKTLIVKSEMFNKKGEMIKVMEVLECVLVQDIWSATKVKMSDLKSGSNTLLTYTSLGYHGDYTAYVNEGFLKTGEHQESIATN